MCGGGVFNKCTGCGYQWGGRDTFLADPQVRLIGYQVNFDDLNAGFFLFNHLNPKCLTTMGIPAVAFKSLYNGEMFSERQTESMRCPGHCRYAGNLEVCPEKCECSFLREVMQIVLRWPKVEAA